MNLQTIPLPGLMAAIRRNVRDVYRDLQPNAKAAMRLAEIIYQEG